MKILITAGGTIEPIDRVRGISNFATGMLGKIIAEECLKISTFEEVYFLAPKTSSQPLPNPKLQIIIANDTNQVRQKMKELIQKQKVDVLIHSMAISDYQVDKILDFESLTTFISKNSQKWNSDWQNNFKQLKSILKTSAVISPNQKISSQIENPILFLKPTPKIASEVKTWNSKLYYVGFKLLYHVDETELVETAQEAMVKNDYQLVVANDLKEIKGSQHVAYLIQPNGKYQKLKTKPKIAQAIIKQILQAKK